MSYISGRRHFSTIFWLFSTIFNILRHFATFGNILWHFTTFCDILWHFSTVARYQNKKLQNVTADFSCPFWLFWHFSTFCDILRQLVTFYNILQLFAIFCNILRHFSTIKVSRKMLKKVVLDSEKSCHRWKKSPSTLGDLCIQVYSLQSMYASAEIFYVSYQACLEVT